jgi:hypothetical protein
VPGSIAGGRLAENGIEKIPILGRMVENTTVSSIGDVTG